MYHRWYSPLFRNVRTLTWRPGNRQYPKATTPTSPLKAEKYSQTCGKLFHFWMQKLHPEELVIPWLHASKIGGADIQIQGVLWADLFPLRFNTITGITDGCQPGEQSVILFAEADPACRVRLPALSLCFLAAILAACWQCRPLSRSTLPCNKSRTKPRQNLVSPLPGFIDVRFLEPYNFVLK